MITSIITYLFKEPGSSRPHLKNLVDPVEVNALWEKWLCSLIQFCIHSFWWRIHQELRLSMIFCFIWLCLFYFRYDKCPLYSLWIQFKRLLRKLPYPTSLFQFYQPALLRPEYPISYPLWWSLKIKTCGPPMPSYVQSWTENQRISSKINSQATESSQSKNLATHKPYIISWIYWRGSSLSQTDRQTDSACLARGSSCTPAVYSWENTS